MRLAYFNSKGRIYMTILPICFTTGINCFMKARDTYIKLLKKKRLILGGNIRGVNTVYVAIAWG
jgi:hypothetical protein